jgi:hypothetical protein
MQERVTLMADDGLNLARIDSPGHLLLLPGVSHKNIKRRRENASGHAARLPLRHVGKPTTIKGYFPRPVIHYTAMLLAPPDFFPSPLSEQGQNVSRN